jgi:hypothetical protein
LVLTDQDSNPRYTTLRTRGERANLYTTDTVLKIWTGPKFLNFDTFLTILFTRGFTPSVLVGSMLFIFVSFCVVFFFLLFVFVLCLCAQCHLCFWIVHSKYLIEFSYLVVAKLSYKVLIKIFLFAPHKTFLHGPLITFIFCPNKTSLLDSGKTCFILNRKVGLYFVLMGFIVVLLSKDLISCYKQMAHMECFL